MRDRPLPRGQLYFDPLGTLTEVVRDWVRHAGPRDVQAFADAIATEHDAKHAVLLPHARIAFEAILATLDLKPGSEVLMTPVTIPDIVNVVLDAGLVPVWVDMGPCTANMDPGDLEAKVTRKSKAVIVTHLCGLPTDMDAVNAVAAAHDLVVLEDASQAMGATWGDRALGTVGLAGVFSLTTLKTLSSFQGGLVLTDDDALAEALEAKAASYPEPARAQFTALLLRDLVLHAASHPLPYGLVGHHVVRLLEAIGPKALVEFQRGNLLARKAHTLQAVRRRVPERYRRRYAGVQGRIALRALPTLAAGNARRRVLSERLLTKMAEADLPGRPRVLEGGTATWWRFPYWTDRPEALRAHLRREGIDSARTNLICASDVPAFRSVASPTPEARRFTAGMVFLPMHPSMSEHDVDRIAEAVSAFEDRS